MDFFFLEQSREFSVCCRPLIAGRYLWLHLYLKRYLPLINSVKFSLFWFVLTAICELGQ